MAEDTGESLLTISKPKGLERPTKVGQLVEEGLLGMLDRTPTIRLIDQLHAKTKDVLYGELVNPGRKDQITNLSERNRQILLWAYDKGISISSALTKRETYSIIPTRELLEQVFSGSDLQALQGALVYQVGRGIKDLDPANIVAFGGILYSQSKIRDEDEPIVEQLATLYFSVPKGAKEPGILPGFLRSNVKGAIHVLPYGKAEKVQGKEKETLLMLADDVVALLKFLEQSKTMGFPRFILNATNRAMGKAAKRYMGAQVIELGDTDRLLLVLKGSFKKSPINNDVVKVFIPRKDLKEGQKKAITMRDKLAKRLASRRGISEDALLKEVRLEAVESILQRLRFTSEGIVRTAG